MTNYLVKTMENVKMLMQNHSSAVAKKTGQAKLAKKRVGLFVVKYPFVQLG